MRIGKYVKASAERKRYQIDYTDWLDTGETIASVAFTPLLNTISPVLVVDAIGVLPSQQGVQYYVSGGVTGATYEVDVLMTTAAQQPQVRKDAILVTIREP